MAYQVLVRMGTGCQGSVEGMVAILGAWCKAFERLILRCQLDVGAGNVVARVC